MRRWLLLLPLVVAGCDGIQSVTGGQGRDSQSFNSLFTFFNIVTGVLFLLVLAFLLAAILRRRGSRSDGISDEGTVATQEGALNKGLIGWTVFIALGLAVLTIASWLGDRRAAAGSARPIVDITVTARQWWWQVDYQGVQANQGFTTANEIHLPVGVPARITLKSQDVIHSFWIPNIAGKQDLIPGRQNDILVTPTAEGVFRGQCAEFCGLQHAHMAFDVVVESPEAFARWRRAQLAPPPAPDNSLRKAGYDYVTTRECATCHNISGTPASGRFGPDLTHLASRRSIGAGTYPMSRGHLYGWVADPQSAKPGNQMPVVGLEPDELHAVVAYLESLK
jgi:cytochrome c oxidase subunit II